MGIIETGKEIGKLAQQLGNMPIQQKVIDLQGELLNVQEELQRLRQENAELKNVEKINAELRKDENCYRRPGARHVGPFCIRCWDVDRKLVNLDVTSCLHPVCPACDKAFSSAESRQAERRSQEQAADEGGFFGSPDLD